MISPTTKQRFPTGTITFLFTDIEGSTKTWEAHPEEMRLALARHDALMQQAIVNAGGVIFKTIGDAFCAAFATAPEALAAAVAAQRALYSESWPDDMALRVRMALHTGTAEERDEDYYGPVLNRVARLLSAGHGGQILVSAATCELVRDHLPGAVELQDLGRQRLKDLDRPEQVYQVIHPELTDRFPPLRTLDHAPNNLPQQITSFIGREREMASVRELLRKTRLLTLTGPGGTGKTRLSLQVAADALESYDDGVWLVELAPIADPALLAKTVAEAFHIKEHGGQDIQQTVLENLKAKNLLLILDNCEHLVATCSAFTAALLRCCPDVHVLATSREALNISGEQTYRVPSLSLPDPRDTVVWQTLSQYESVRLFIERAQSVRADFAVSNQNAPAVANLCFRLDGIPLALELAAARVRSLSVEDINSRLDSRFRLLTGGDRSALPRQQTLRALVDWSYDLLREQERLLLTRLSVFAGGWTLPAAESVCGFAPIEDWEVMDLLTSLVDKSLVVADEESGIVGYRMLETLRQYGTEKREAAGETPQVRDRHRSWFRELAERAEHQLTRRDQVLWIAQLEMAHDNLRAALRWCEEEASEKSIEAGLHIAGSLWRFWRRRGCNAEGRKHLTKLIALARQQSRDWQETQDTALANALCGVGALALSEGDYAESRCLLEDSLSLSQKRREKQGIAAALNLLGDVASFQGDYETAKVLHSESLAIYRSSEDTSGIALSLRNLGGVVFWNGDPETGRTLAEESLTLSRSAGDLHGIILALNILGNIALDQKDFPAARGFYEEGLVLSREVRETQNIAVSLGNLGGVANALGDAQTARRFTLESLALYREIGDKQNIAYSLASLAEAYSNENEMRKAVVLWGASDTLRERLGAPLTPKEQADQDQQIEQARVQLTAQSGADAFSAAWEEGRHMTWEQAVGL